MLIPACASTDLVMKKGAMVVIKYVDGIFVDADSVSVHHGADGALLVRVLHFIPRFVIGSSVYAKQIVTSGSSGSSPGRVQMHF